MRYSCRAFLSTCITLAAISIPQPSCAFYEYTNSDFSFELRGSTRIYGTVQENPEKNAIYTEHYDESWGGVVRLLADASIGERYSFSANILEVVRSTAFTGQSTAPATLVERSSIFIKNQHDTANTKAYIEIDHLFFKHQTDRIELTVGRQPINLATTFFFILKGIYF